MPETIQLRFADMFDILHPAPPAMQQYRVHNTTSGKDSPGHWAAVVMTSEQSNHRAPPSPQ